MLRFFVIYDKCARFDFIKKKNPACTLQLAGFFNGNPIG